MDEEDTAEGSAPVPIARYLMVIMEYAHFFMSVVGASTQMFLIVLICRQKRLRTRTNLLMLNMLAVGGLYNVVEMMYFWVEVFGLWHVPLLVDVFFELYGTTMMLYVVFSVLLALDWTLANFKRGLPKWIYLAVYSVAIVEYVAAVAYDDTYHYLPRLAVTRIVHASCALLLAVLNVLRRKMAARIDASSRRTEYSFFVSNVVVSSVLPYLLWHMLYIVVDDEQLAQAFRLALFVPAAAWALHPVLVAYKLGAWDKNFKMAYAQALRRSSARSYGDGGGLDGEDAEGGVQKLPEGRSLE